MVLYFCEKCNIRMRQKAKPTKKVIRRKQNSSKKTYNENWLLPVSILLISILLTGFVYPFKSKILLAVFNYYCIQPKLGSYGEEIIFRAINLNHSIPENRFNKDKLIEEYLNNPVIWYSKKAKSAEMAVGSTSKYDCFCFSEKSTYDDEEKNVNNYEIRFNGFHRYRNPKSNFIEMESGFAKIENGKISELTSYDKYEGYTPEAINFIFHNFVWLIFGFFLIVTTFFTAITKLPVELISLFIQAISKLFRLS